MFKHTGYKPAHYLFIAVTGCIMFAWYLEVFTRPDFLAIVPLPETAAFIFGICMMGTLTISFLYAMLYCFTRRLEGEVKIPLRRYEAMHSLAYSWCVIYAFFVPVRVLHWVSDALGIESNNAFWPILLIAAASSLAAAIQFRRVFQPRPDPILLLC